MKPASIQEPDIPVYAVSHSRKESDCSISLQLHIFMGVHYRQIYTAIKILYNTITATQRLHIQNNM